MPANLGPTPIPAPQDRAESPPPDPTAPHPPRGSGGRMTEGRVGSWSGGIDRCRRPAGSEARTGVTTSQALWIVRRRVAALATTEACEGSQSSLGWPAARGRSPSGDARRSPGARRSWQIAGHGVGLEQALDPQPLSGAARCSPRRARPAGEHWRAGRGARGLPSRWRRKNNRTAGRRILPAPGWSCRPRERLTGRSTDSRWRNSRRGPLVVPSGGSRRTP